MGKLTPQRRPGSAKRVVAVLPIHSASKTESDSTPQRAETPTEYQSAPTIHEHDPGPGRSDRRMFSIERPVVIQNAEKHLPEPETTPVKTKLHLPKPRLAKPQLHLPNWRTLPWTQLRRVVLAWILPVVLSLSLLLGVHARAKADPAPTPTELQQYLQNHALNVYETVSGDYPQLFYSYQGHVIQLTSSDYASVHPIDDGQYVAWLGIIDGQSQVFLEDVLSGSVIQLSQVAPNEGLSIAGNQLAWQGWDGQHWQIYYYNGFVVQQLTNGDNSSIHAAIGHGQVLYATQLDTEDWKAYSYDTSTAQTTFISEGDTVSTAFPHFNSDGSAATSFVPY